MSSVGDSPAKTSVSPGKEQALKESVPDSGVSLLESLAKFDQATSSWRTAQCLLFEDSTECLETFPRWGMMRDGELWELSMSELLISESESGSLLPTPNSSDGTHGVGKKLIPGGKYQSMRNLPTIAARDPNGKIWPTPQARDWKDTGPTQGNRKNPNLGTAVHWPTPQARDWKGPSGRSLKGEENDLPNAVKYQTFPTPTATDAIKNGKVSPRPRAMGLSETTGGSLNPTWVEWLMGWPIGFTDLKPLEMDKYQQWQHSHGRH
jgi:hypothetical protein